MFLAVCISYFEVSSLTLHKVLGFFSPHFLKGISYDQENLQNAPTSSTQAAQSEPSQPPSTTRLLIQVLSSPLAPTPSPFWVVKNKNKTNKQQQKTPQHSHSKHILSPPSLPLLPRSPRLEGGVLYPSLSLGGSDAQLSALPHPDI